MLGVESGTTLEQKINVLVKTMTNEDHCYRPLSMMEDYITGESSTTFLEEIRKKIYIIVSFLERSKST